ncbi:UDP-glucose 6-dehydrogenase, partial [Glaciecola sp.]|nr:UDP-glucose 6-dehydrogenase [Glaciecola sp.]
EWQAFRAPDFTALAIILKDKVVFDGRNLFEPTIVAEHGLAYYGIGRGLSIKGRH